MEISSIKKGVWDAIINRLGIERQLQMAIKNQTLYTPEKKYTSELDKWCRHEGDLDAYAETFYRNIENDFRICVSYDILIADSALTLLKNLAYIEFAPQQEYRSPLRQNLKKVMQVLGEYGMVSQHDCRRVISTIETDFQKEKITKFIDFVRSRKEKNGCQLEWSEVDKLWKQAIQRNFDEFWAYLHEKKINDPIILELYDAALPRIKTSSITKIQEITDNQERIKKTFREINEHALLFKGLFKATDKSQKNKEYGAEMDRLITRKSLILQKDKLDLAHQQIKNVVATIKKGLPPGRPVAFELYGSIKTGFAIIGESDADIEIIPQDCLNMMKHQKVEYLELVYKALRTNILGLLEYSGIEPFINDKIRIPFIKVKFQNHFNFNVNTRNVLRSMDLIVSTPNGLRNSQMLELYSKSEYIVKLCNLVKLWAKRKTLINPKMPHEGLSSYGIILMVLFYLIKTNQAPYVIEVAAEYRLEKNLLPQKDYEGLFDNFRGFLEFYRCGGSFFNENLIVCLKEKFIPTPYSGKYLVNMHDFIDNSNPGRIGKHLSNKFFNIVSKTHSQLINHEPLDEIMKKQQWE